MGLSTRTTHIMGRTPLLSKYRCKLRSISNVENHNKARRPNSISGDSTTASKKDEERLLQSLAFPEMFDRRNQIDIAHPSTCMWIFDNDQYLSWKADTQGLLWIKGKPGSGKSTLMGVLRDTIKRSNNVVYLDFFFSARGSELQRSALGMLRSLLHQLYTEIPAARAALLEHYRKNCIACGGEGSGWSWQRAELERLFMQTIVRCAKDHQVEIFVDALDEADKEASSLARWFHMLNSGASTHAANLKICISCRHYPVQTVLRSKEIWVESQNYQDIKLVVHEHLDFVDDDEQWNALKQNIIDRAQGIFQWVRITLYLVEGAYQDGLSVNEITHSLSQVPQELIQVYEYVIKKVISQNHREESLLLFQWICLAARPLTLMEMYQVLNMGKREPASDTNESSIESQMQRRIVALSGGLLEAVNTDLHHNNDTSDSSSGDSEDNDESDDAYASVGRANLQWRRGRVIQVVHQSVADYLMGGGLQLLDLLRKAPEATMAMTSMDEQQRLIQQLHATMYRLCLKFIMSQERSMEKKLQHFDSDWGGWVMFNLARSLICDIDLLEYAVVQLFKHAADAQSQRTNNLVQEIQSLKRIFPFWKKATTYLNGNWQRTEWPHHDTTILHMVARFGLIDIFDALSKDENASNNVNLLAKDERGLSAIHHATEFNRQSMVFTLHAAGVSIDSETIDRRTPLLIAAQEGHADLVRWFLDNGANLHPNAQNNDTFAPLQDAILGGSIPIFQLLLDRGADINHSGGYGGTALQTAAACGDEFMVLAALSAGAQIDQVTARHGTALHAAVLEGHASIVSILLDEGARTDLSYEDYGTPFHMAVRYGHLNVVLLLIDAGVDVNMPDDDGCTAFEDAVWCWKSWHGIRLIEVLIEAGANVNMIGGLSEGVLALAIRSHWHQDKRVEEIVSALLDAGADVNFVGEHFGTALQVASRYGLDSIVRLLIAAGADVNLRGGDYNSPWVEAFKSGHIEAEATLLEAGAKIEAIKWTFEENLDIWEDEEDEAEIQIPTSFDFEEAAKRPSKPT